MIASQGKLCATGGRFSFAEVQVITAQVDVDATRMNQARTASYLPNLAGEDDGLITVPFAWPVLTPELAKSDEPAWERSDNLKAEEFSRAVPLALLDYLRKSRARGFVVAAPARVDTCTLPDPGVWALGGRRPGWQQRDVRERSGLFQLGQATVAQGLCQSGLGSNIPDKALAQGDTADL